MNDANLYFFTLYNVRLSALDRDHQCDLKSVQKHRIIYTFKKLHKFNNTPSIVPIMLDYYNNYTFIYLILFHTSDCEKCWEQVVDNERRQFLTRELAQLSTKLLNLNEQCKN